MFHANTSVKEPAQLSDYLSYQTPPVFIFNRDGTCISALGISDAHTINLECFLGDNLNDILPETTAKRLYNQLLSSADQLTPLRDEVLLPIFGQPDLHWFLSEFIPLSSSLTQPMTVMWKLTDIHDYVVQNEALLDSQLVETDYAVSNKCFFVKELCEELKLIQQYDTELAITYVELVKNHSNLPLPLSSYLTLEQNVLCYIKLALSNGQSLSRIEKHRYLILQPGLDDLKAKLVAELLLEELTEQLENTGYTPQFGVLNISRQSLGPAIVDQELACQLIEEASKRVQ